MAAGGTAHAATGRLTGSPGLVATSMTFRGNVRLCRSPCRVPPGPHDNGAAYLAVSELRGVPVRRHQSQSRRAPLGLAGSLPMRCPECGRRFELADGEVIEPPDAVEDDSKA